MPRRFTDRVDDLRSRPALVATPPSPLRRVLVPFLAVLGLLALAIWPAASAASDLKLSAYGDLVDPTSPNPLNVLPSTVKGTLPMTGVPGRQQYLATLLYKYGRTPAFWSAVAAQTAGTATPGQITLVQQANGSFGVPATKTGGFLKVVGGVGTAISGYSIGSTIGHATLELVGFDADGAVCENTTGIVRDAVAVLTGADCSGFVEMSPTFYPNADVTVVPPGWRARGQIGPGANGTALTLAGSVVSDNPSQLLVTVQVVIAGTGGVNMSNHVVYCRNPANGTISPMFLPSGPFGTFTSGVGYALGSYTHTCTAGWTVYSFKSSQGGGATPWDPETAAKVNEYYAPGTPPAVSYPGVSPDPLRTLRCVVTHSSGELTRDSATFRESDGVIPQVLCPDVEGLVVESIEILEVNVEDGSWLTLWSESTTPEYQTAVELAPECSNGTCLLDLRNAAVSCFQQPSACAGWMSDPNRDSTYSCHYGTHAVDLAECFVYAPAFEPGATSTGNVYGDPDTGVTVGAPAGSAPGSDSATFGAAVKDPEGDRQCFPTGWAVLNPVEWVMKPVACALEWAFVPRQSVILEVATTTRTAWDETVVGQGIGLTSVIMGDLPAGVSADCVGPAVTFSEPLDDFGMDGTWYPLNSCSEPMATVRTVAYWALPAFTAFGLLFALVRYVAAILGYVGFGGAVVNSSNSKSGVQFE